MPEPEYTQGPWGPMGNPHLTPEKLWTPNRGVMEVSPGLTIGSIHHTEPICRVFGYLLPVVTNAHLIAAAPDLLEALEQLLTHNKQGKVDGISLSRDNWVRGGAAIAKARGETP